MRVPLKRTTRVSSLCRASINNLLVIYVSLSGILLWRFTQSCRALSGKLVLVSGAIQMPTGKQTFQLGWMVVWHVLVAIHGQVR